MSELRTLWNEYELIEKSGQGRTVRSKEIEAMIHKKQKELKLPPYDFDTREIKKSIMAQSTVSGPPDPSSIPIEDVGKPTFDKIRKEIGENDCSILDYCTNWAEIRMVYIASVADKLNPENSNVARRGQVINLSMQKFYNMKSNGETLEE